MGFLGPSSPYRNIEWLTTHAGDDQTILDDIYKATVAKDYEGTMRQGPDTETHHAHLITDETRLQKVIDTTVERLIPDCNAEPPRNMMRTVLHTYSSLDSWTLKTTIKNTIVADGYQRTWHPHPC